MVKYNLFVGGVSQALIYNNENQVGECFVMGYSTEKHEIAICDELQQLLVKPIIQLEDMKPYGDRMEPEMNSSIE